MRNRILIATVSLVVGSGCASVGLGPRTPDSTPTEIRELRATATRHEIEIERLRREVARLTLLLEPQQSAARSPSPALAPPGPALPPATPRVEEADLEAPPPTSAPPSAVVEPPGTGRVDELSEAAQAIYDQGYALYHQNRYLEAETAFQRFLQGWGSSSLGDNALYWIGACRLARGETDTALAAFREVSSRYPEGNKVPDALLKVAEIAERQGDQQGALDAYRRLVAYHPESAAASLARERLERR